MHIFIKSYTGKTIILDVEQNDSIYSVKHKIQNKIDIPPNRQKLMFTNKILRDGTLLDHNIQEYFTIHLIKKLLGSIQIFVDTKTLEVEPDDSIDNLKDYIEHKIGMPANMQLLIYSGKILRDGILSDYGIKQNSIIRLNLRLSMASNKIQI